MVVVTLFDILKMVAEIYDVMLFLQIQGDLDLVGVVRLTDDVRPLLYCHFSPCVNLSPINHVPDFKPVFSCITNFSASNSSRRIDQM